eukprot:jgi/Pico_ML_1/55143/g139.t1
MPSATMKRSTSLASLVDAVDRTHLRPGGGEGILSALHEIEQRRKDGPVNVLKLLSTNTRRTKVVELNTGTHRVPEELRKHCLVDEDNSQYSTNLDRNRYGSDDQYLATVVRFDLDFVGLCPCLVDIEIIDAKSGNESLVIAATKEECNCHSPPKSPNLAQALASSCVQKVAVKPVMQKSSSSVDVKNTNGGMKKSKSGLDMLFFAALDATKPEEKERRQCGNRQRNQETQEAQRGDVWMHHLSAEKKGADAR